MPEPNRDVASALEALSRLGERLAGGQSPADAILDVEALRKDSAAFTTYLGDLVRDDRFRNSAEEPLDLAALDDAERWSTALGAFHCSLSAPSRSPLRRLRMRRARRVPSSISR